MRRLLSILLLAILSLGPAISAIPANALASGWTGKVDESRIPACCRRGGKHHCGMAGELKQADFGRETTVAANEACPCAPQAIAATAPSVAAVLNSPLHSALLASQLRVRLNAVTLAVLASRRSQPKRGPPTLSSI
jgi:hypothetical protein